MLKHLYFVIFLTFVTGLATGVYVFLMTRESDSGVEGKTIVEEKGFEILATGYGGCERIGCASYRLLDDGSYVYLATNSERTYVRYEDELSLRQRDIIWSLVFDTALDTVIRKKFTGSCPAEYDGIAYRFDIRREGETFHFDTCTEELGNEKLFIELIKYFGIMDATHRSY